MWKERLLFLAVSAVLGGYVALWVLGEAVAGDDSGPPLDKQSYARAGELGPLPKGVEAVFASSNPADSWDESLPHVWVPPTVVEPTKAPDSVELPPPPASVPAPPMLLPLPGPASEYSDGLPRWPNVPTGGAK
jgi:hypothetical protein